MADDEQSGRDGDRDTAGQKADPVAAMGDALAQAGGPAAGEPGAGGSAYASGGQHGRGEAAPSGGRQDAPSQPPSNAVAPPARTAMDDAVKASDETAKRTAAP